MRQFLEDFDTLWVAIAFAEAGERTCTIGTRDSSEPETIYSIA